MTLRNVVKVAIIGDEHELKHAVKEGVADLKKVGDEGEHSSSKLGKFAKVAGAGIATGIGIGVAAIGMAIHSADELNESQEQLQLSVENTGGSWEDFRKQLGKVQKTGEGLGYTNAEINDGLAALTTATGSSQKAIQLLGVAQDLAAKKGIPLKEAAIAVAKASEGQIKPLKMLGIDLPIAAGGAVKTAAAMKALGAAQSKVAVIEAAIHSGRLKGKAASDQLAAANMGLMSAQAAYNDVGKRGDQIVAALAERIDGSASVAADSLAGKTKALHAKFEDLKAHIGQKLIPILLSLVSFIVNRVIPALGAAYAWIQDKGIPILQRFGARITDIYYKYFKPTVDAVVMIVGGLVKQLVGFFDLIRDIVTGKWSNIGADLKLIVTGIVQEVEGLFLGLMSTIGRILGNAVGMLLSAGASLGGAIVGGIKSALKGGANAVIGLINGVIHAVDSFQIHMHVSMPGPIPNVDFDWGGLNIPDIPYFHGGGVFNSGRGEGLAWLQDGEGVFTKSQMRAMVGGSTVINLPAGIDGSGVVRAQRQWDRRNSAG